MGLLDALLRSVAGDLVNPLVALPAIALGWFARRTWMLYAGAIVIALVQTTIALLAPLPPNAERLLWAEPLRVIAPGLLCYAPFRLKRRLRSGGDAAKGSAFSRCVRTVLCALTGAGAGGALLLALGLAAITVGDIHDREGGEAYLLVFVLVPLGVTIGLVCGAALGWRRSGRASRISMVDGHD